MTGCQAAPYVGELTTVQPKKEDVTGLYQFKEQTISQTPIDKRGQTATILLRRDGTYQANNIPNVFGGDDAQIHKYISGSGNWKMEIIGSVDSGWGKAKHEWGISLTSINENLANISFTGEKPPYGLMLTYDDPDLGYMMRFEKIE